MPDPLKLKIGDRVRFVSLPEEWKNTEYFVHKDCRKFMSRLIKRNRSSRVCEMDDSGYPWIAARLRVGKRVEHHKWLITESSGWVPVIPRSPAR